MKSSKLAKLKRKAYRDQYVLSHLEQGLAHQIKTLRNSRGLTQLQLAKALNLKSQSAIARLEDPSYGKMSLPTLMKVAHYFDVAFMGRFVPYSKFFRETEDLRPDALTVKNFTEEDEQGLLEFSMPTRIESVNHVIFIKININNPSSMNRIIDITPATQQIAHDKPIRWHVQQPATKPQLIYQSSHANEERHA